MKRSYSSSTGNSETIEGLYGDEDEEEVVGVFLDRQSDKSASSLSVTSTTKAKKRPTLPSSRSSDGGCLSSPCTVTATAATATTKGNKGGEGIASKDGEDLSSSSSSSSSLLLLPKGYVPEPHTIICARGKKYWDHVGNVRYRNIIAAATKRYEQTTNKYDKTLIVSEIVQTLQQKGGGSKAAAAAAAAAAPISNFIKLDPSNKQRWMYETDEIFIREKISQSLRDCLSSKYKSSTKSKKLRKSRMIMMESSSSWPSSSQVGVDTMESVIYSNEQISQRIHKLSNDLQIFLSNDDNTTTTTHNNNHGHQSYHTHNNHDNNDNSYSYSNRYEYGDNFYAYQRQQYYNNNNDQFITATGSARSGFTTAGGGGGRTTRTIATTTTPPTTQVVVRGRITMDSTPTSTSPSLLPISRNINNCNNKVNKEKELLSLFNQANCDILETIKQDVTLRSKFQDAVSRSSTSSPPPLSSKSSGSK